ncbi:MAG: RdgB/HAM1 family non-canonical purine NTP pyrophosphatase [Microcystaceae cyanobacterium]
MKKLIIATSNPGKLKEIEAYFVNYPVALAIKPKEIEIEETGTTFLENACLKASQVAQQMGEWAIADDSGLAVDRLQGAPGIYSARYGKTDQGRIERLLRELGETTERSARFICSIAIARPDGSIALQTEGICEGTILSASQGKGGFGYDPIFYVPEYNQTFAEMSAELKHRISHRGKAFEQLLPQLSKIDF